MHQLITSVKDSAKSSSYFKSYLFGFIIADFALPPWQCIHFRDYTHKSPFKPWGMPMYIRSVAPYRMLDMSMSLQVVARGAKFPIEVYEVSLPPTANITDKLEAATDFIRDLDNIGLVSEGKDETHLGRRVITVKDLYDMHLEAKEVDLDRIEDIEVLRDDLILSTGLPRTFIDPNSSGFGESGILLREQFKPFARSVYRIQGVYLEELAQAIKIHMIYSGQFNLDAINFTLTMPYPESQTNRDIISSQSDLLSLANDILESLAEKFGVEVEELPVDVIRQVYLQTLPYSPDRIEAWIDLIVKSKEANGEREEAVSKIMKQHKYKVIQEMIQIEFHNMKHNKLLEGAFGGRHFYSSKKKHMSFDVKKLVDFKVQNVKNIKANKPSLFGMREEVRLKLNKKAGDKSE
jgi:hypothetical protein